MNLQSSSRNRIFTVCAAAVLLAALPLFSAQNDSQPRQQASASQSRSCSGTNDQGNGEKKFQQYCSRCHRAPESFSPHITGTIVRHMRVRASLGEQDARDILRYLNSQ